MCIQTPWTTLFLPRDRMSPCQTPFSSLPGRNLAWCASRDFLPVHRARCTARSQCPPALLQDMIPPGSPLHWLYTLCLMGVCEMLLRHYSIRVGLYTGALAYCMCCLQQQFKGLCRAGETMHLGGLCAVDNRPVTCLMKVVRRQIYRLASLYSDTMS